MHFTLIVSILCCQSVILKSTNQSFNMVKSGKFGHQVNSDTRLQTVEIQMRRLIRIFAVCLDIVFFIPIIEL